MSNEWNPIKLDLILSFLIATTFPFIASLLYSNIGAFVPMLIYYGLAWGIVKWRRGETGYFNPLPKKLPKFFLLNLLVIAFGLVCAYFAGPAETFNYSTGTLLTGLFWAPINAATEQLLWIYLFESWDLFPKNEQTEDYSTYKRNKIIFRIIGLVLFSLFIGTIHTFYWVKFLSTVEESSIWGIFFIILTSISGFLHIAVWRESKQMIYTFIPHFILNLVPLFWTKYSIIPYLF